MRRVVLLCGPPGAGKTTAARASGLPVFDRDDEQWTSEAQFREALRAIGETPGARAVVIRAGATSSARRAAAEMIGATHTFLLTQPRDELVRRVRSRGRGDALGTIRGIDRWHEAFDHLDQAPTFVAWSALDIDPTTIAVMSNDW